MKTANWIVEILSKHSASYPARPIPGNYHRIVLINPTRYLGNLLIAGGLIQDFYQYCRARDIRFLLVVDAAYRELLKDSLPAECLLFYPRKLIKEAGFITKLSAYLSCVRSIRRFSADLAFNIEEDSVSHRLTQLSGAGFKLGSNLKRNKHGYDHVLDINYLNRDAKHKHRWHGFSEIFSRLGLPETKPAYLKLALDHISPELNTRLGKLGLDISKPFIIIHASAAKDYKKWPTRYFAELIYLLHNQGYNTALIGAGKADQEANAGILQALKSTYKDIDAIDLCNQLSLSELAVLFTQASAMVGNDSGPFHLASALQLPGCVIFGPTEVALWKPLSDVSVVLKSNEQCAEECTKSGCIFENRCLVAIKPSMVLEKLLPLL
tara:strand:- start:2937 stop:4076 length:1140 start_codon:yes stop_codon:yes gene_type:complete